MVGYKDIKRGCLGFLVASAVVFVSGISQAEENLVVRRLVSRAVKDHLAKVDRLERSWEYKVARRNRAWVDLGVYRQEWRWREVTNANIWIDSPESLIVDFRELQADGDRLVFDVVVELPLEIAAWHQFCEWMDTEFQASCRASLALRGSFGIQAGKVSDPEFEEVAAEIAELSFDRAFCQTFRAPIRSIINAALKQQQERLCVILERELAGNRVY